MKNDSFTFLAIGVCLFLLCVPLLLIGSTDSKLMDKIYQQEILIQQLQENQKDTQKDIDKLEEVLLSGDNLGTFTATYYCA